MPAYKQSKKLLDGEILLYVLANAVNDVWQVRFTSPLPTGTRYIRRSTGHRSEALATAFAMQLYDEYRQRAMLGIQNGSIDIESLVDQTQTGFTNFHVRKTINAFCSKYWSVYFRQSDMSAVTTLQLSNYVEWRIARASENDVRGWQASDGKISLSSLRLDLSLLRSVLRQGKRYGFIATVPEAPKLSTGENVYSLPTNRRGRGRFSTDQYEVLKRDFSSVRVRLNNEKNQPVLTDPNKPPHPINNTWVFRETRHSKSDNDLLSRWSRYSAAVARFACIFVANTGIRPVELMKLRFGDVKLMFDSSDKIYTAIFIDQSVSKVNKDRWAIAANGMEAYRWLLEHKREVSYRFDIEVTDDTWLFPSHDDYNLRAPNIQHQVRNMLKRLDLHVSQHPKRKDVKVYYSLYSFRSWYAVQRLKDRVDLYSLSRCFGASPGRIVETYDTGEGWNVRENMIKTIDRKQTDLENVPDDLKQYASFYEGA